MQEIQKNKFPKQPGVNPLGTAPVQVDDMAQALQRLARPTKQPSAGAFTGKRPIIDPPSTPAGDR
jgi:hypothetical protein